ncbi:MAG: S-methyl-5'-thioadenosine phosphorylase [Acidobacteria bacterium]|jgi:5'-methylthioadenosine phosphorylase|nr:S-methyl-5'-thioadenosine phosphorylase [Acidobacteriota bacterium]
MNKQANIGIIGGSGLYEMEGFTDVRQVEIDTPFGSPSDELVVGTLEGKSVVFLPRHSRGHRILPHELNYRANIFAMKQLGVEWILSVSAVGSLKLEYEPLHMVVPDQFVDRTLQRRSTFFGRGLVAHVAFANPFCPNLSKTMVRACEEAGATYHVGGTYVCIEGPHFSTRAESELYRSWGMDIIGMTNLQEARLAREAEICYSTLAMVTDYDCWHPEHDSVTADQIVANLGRNAGTAKAVLRAAVRRLPIERRCECESALQSALITAPDLVPGVIKRELEPIIGRYIKAD